MDELIPLRNDTLARLSQGVQVPAYDRAALRAGIVHIGLGNFHRGHQAWYVHRLMQIGLAHDWAIVGAGVRPGDAVQRKRLLQQDCLTTLVELDPAGKSAEIIGSMIDFLPVEDGNASLIEQMAQRAIGIVSLTITEGGYFIDPATGTFDAQHPDIVHDAKNPDRPRTAFGAMVAALSRRRANGTGPFTGLSCDNLQGNGAILRQAVVSIARMSDPDLANWIDRECSFPNSMVDCIVPATGPKELALARSFGIDDKAPVTHENFRQWVVEDSFCAGRPEWDRVGVTFATDVDAHETMKLRILNGGHQLISVPADLLGIDTIHAAMAHRGIHSFFRKTIAEEVAPTVSAVPGMTPQAYLDLVDRRFSNSEIIDTTRRVAFDGSSRQPGFVIPSIRDALAAGCPIDGLALMSALWMRYCQGLREDGSPIARNDPNWETLHHLAIGAAHSPETWLGQRHIYGDLSQSPRFTTAFVNWTKQLGANGVEETLNRFGSSAELGKSA